MNLFKLFIPKEKAQTVTELESWTVTWQTHWPYPYYEKTHHKVFVKEAEAEEFKKQIIESATFLNAWYKVEVKKN